MMLVDLPPPTRKAYPHPVQTFLIMIRVVMMLAGFSTTYITRTSYLITAPEIRICDEDYIPRIVLDGYKNLLIQNDTGTATHGVLKYPGIQVYAQYLIKGRIIHYVTGTSVYALIIKQVDATRDTITVSGNEYADDLLSARIALVNVQDGARCGRDTGLGRNRVPPLRQWEISLEATDTYRRDPISGTGRPLIMARRNKLVTISARFENLLDLCETIGSLGEYRMAVCGCRR